MTIRLTNRWPRGSLRLRFLAAILIWVALGITGIWTSATSLFARHMTRQYHEDLAGHIKELAELIVVSPTGHLTLTRPLSDPRFTEDRSGYYWQVSVWHGDRLHSGSLQHGLLDEDIAHSPQVFHTVENGPTGPAITYGFIRLTPDRRVIHYVIATDQAFLDRSIASFTREMTLWLIALAVALVGTGLVAIAFALRPLDRLGHAVAALRNGSSAQAQGSFPVEIAPLVDDLNAYVAENKAIIERGRVQAGNLAHGLRTPLAVITDEAELLALRNGPEAASGEALLQQAEIMAGQIDYHLARARSAASAGRRIGGQASTLPDLLDPLLRAMRKLHGDRTFVLTAPPPFRIAIDPVDLSELLSILLDNAGKWARARIDLTIAPAAIIIRDDGPGMTPPQIAAACDIGSRFDAAMPGSGLGLAIARDIAQAYGMTLTLTQDNGLVARLTGLPVEA